MPLVLDKQNQEALCHGDIHPETLGSGPACLVHIPALPLISSVVFEKLPNSLLVN